MRLPAAFVCFGLVIASAAGCTTVGPDFEKPDPVLPAAYSAPVPPIFSEGAVGGPWWCYFNDSILDSLLVRALDTNIDILVAQSRVREARAIARGVVADTGPSVGVAGEAGIEAGDSADDGFLGAILSGEWEIDLFGRIARTRQAAWALAEREEALEREARRLTLGEIARAYVLLRSAARRLELTRQSLELQVSTLDLVRRRVDLGLAPGLDRARAEAEVASLRADLGPLRTDIGRFANALAVLLGAPPGSLDAELDAPEAPIPHVVAGPVVGVPVDLVRRRPDIQAAELQIAAATADVGIAVADLYPRLTLPGAISVGVTGLGSASIVRSVLASISALVDYPLFDGGAREETITAAEERLIQAALAYRLTLLRALEQVESALLGYEGARARLEALNAAVAGNRQAYEQSQELYRQGLVGFIDVIDSQRQWNESLQELAGAEEDVGLEIVNLFTALGGTVSADGAEI